MSKIAIYPGSFDPVTLGHISVLERASRLFDEVYLLIVHNPQKQSKFDLATRLEMAQQAVAEKGLTSSCIVQIMNQGLLATAAKRMGAEAIVKGFRNSADIDYEMPMAQVNEDLSGIQTIFLPADDAFGEISSSLVKEVFSLGGDVSKYVSESVLRKMQEERK
ncbi:MAG: pantetheine-phosphate adenylyltransferase [Aquiluna sp.]|nr:pantetheine-phosphate adenylyltransferase [Aquiluna sp.]